MKIFMWIGLSLALPIAVLASPGNSALVAYLFLLFTFAPFWALTSAALVLQFWSRQRLNRISVSILCLQGILTPLLWVERENVFYAFICAGAALGAGFLLAFYLFWFFGKFRRIASGLFLVIWLAAFTLLGSIAFKEYVEDTAKHVDG